MILFILTLVVLLVGIGLLIVARIKAHKKDKEWGTEHYWEITDFTVGGYGLALNITGCILLFFELIILLCTRLPVEEQRYYEEMKMEREIIVYRLENEDAILNGNTDLYDDLSSFNNEVRNHKMMSDNIWIGMFFNQKIQDLEYIDLREVNND